MVDVWLPYGNTEVCLRIPTRNYLGTIGPRDKKGVEDPESEIERSLEEPIGTDRLSDIAKPGEKVSIVVSCVEDSEHAEFILKTILKELNKANVENKDVSIIKGYDPLRGYPAIDDPQLQNDETFRGVELITHNPETENMVEVGKTSFGTQIGLSRMFMESDLKILAGILDPHPYAGYSGGRYCVLPGVSSPETIQQTLSLVTDPMARSGMTKGNPVHENMVEAAGLARVDFTLNVVRNSKREVVRAFAGHPDDAFISGVEFADEIYKVPVEKRADAVFVSPGGFPYDVDLYESCKVVNNALEVVKKNGTIILVAECSKGYGNADFRRWIVEVRDLNRIERQLRRRFSAAAYVARSFITLLQRSEVVLVSSLPDFFALGVLNVKTARTVNEAIRYFSDASGRNASVLAISHGSITIPVLVR
ncbi:MAG: nickel-dependent lactate racemase [Candidatus Bathyarchaeia archaeon]